MSRSAVVLATGYGGPEVLELVEQEVAEPRPGEAVLDVRAAGLMLAGVTAIHALTAVAAKPGETVLVHAASGAVGRIAVQVARARGINVIGTAAPARHDELRALGVEPVAYGDGLLERVRG